MSGFIEGRGAVFRSSRRRPKALLWGLIATLCLGLCLSVPAAAEVYRWKDDAGNIHFSDRPHPSAEPIDVNPQLPGAVEETAAGEDDPPAEGADQAEEEERPVVEAYTGISVNSPRRNQQIGSAEGALEVSLGLEPGLGRGHSVRLLMDGSEVIPPFEATQARIDGIPAGSHTLMATVVNENGEEMIRSPIISFFMRR